MTYLNEVIIRNMKLSEIQLAALAKIVSDDNKANIQSNTSTNPDYQEDDSGRNIAAANDALQKMGFIAVISGSSSVTDKGMQQLEKEGLVDPGSKELNQKGQEYADKDSNSEQETPQPDMNAAPTDSAAPGGAPPADDFGAPAGGPELPPMESIFMQVNQDVEQRLLIDKLI